MWNLTHVGLESWKKSVSSLVNLFKRFCVFCDRVDVYVEPKLRINWNIRHLRTNRHVLMFGVASRVSHLITQSERNSVNRG